MLPHRRQRVDHIGWRRRDVRGQSHDTSIQGGVENVELGGDVTDVLFLAGVLKLADPKGLDGTMSLEGFPKKGLVIDFENTQVTDAEIHEKLTTSIYSI